MQVPRTRILLMLGVLFVGLGAIVILQVQSLGKLRIIVCDVGQGDAILMITPGGHQIMVDGGPGSRVLGCLSDKMPFWDRNVDAVFLTHPQQDHMEGLVSVLANYKVKMIGETGVKNNTALFTEWQKATESEHAKIYMPKRGDRLIIDSSRGSNVSIEILWPHFAPQGGASRGKPSIALASAGKPSIEEWKVNPPKDLNDSSIIMRVSYGSICVYLTGDIPKEILQTVIDKPCQILKVAHHGSRTGTNQEVMDKAKPKIAVIQVGKNNRFGHPHKEVVDILNSKGVKILRNDESGTIEVDTDGKSFNFKAENWMPIGTVMPLPTFVRLFTIVSQEFYGGNVCLEALSGLQAFAYS